MLRSFALPALLGLLISAMPSAVESSEAAVAGYFQGRFQAMDGAGPTQIARISESNVALQRFVDQDLIALRSLVASFPSQVDRTHEVFVEQRVGLTFQVYEKTTITWHNGPQLLTSGIGYRHTVTIEPAGNTYRIAKDEFRGVGWDSPDVTQVSEIAPRQGSRAPGLASPAARPLGTTGTYSRYTASSYAVTYYSSYNPNYYNFNSAGGDCTNFVSQALLAGGQVEGSDSDSAGWWYNGSAAYPYSGTAWRHSVWHEPWLINSSRGYTVSQATSLDAGDIIYYDWNDAGTATDHTVMVTGYTVPGNRSLVTMHNPDLVHVYWDTWMSGSLLPLNAHFLRMWDTFNY
jgi:hypothetical protein